MAVCFGVESAKHLPEKTGVDAEFLRSDSALAPGTLVLNVEVKEREDWECLRSFAVEEPPDAEPPLPK
jgi:hypothetical protein